MELGNVRAAVSVVRTIRDDWDQRMVQGQIEQMSLEYPHKDVVYAAIEIAEDLRNGSPVTLTMKAGDILEKLHAKTPTRKPGTRRGGQEQWLCDVCGMTRHQCEQQAGNLNGEDHTFRSITAAEADREKQRNQREFPPGGRDLSDYAFGRLPADVAALSNPTTQNPEPQQEEAAS